VPGNVDGLQSVRAQVVWHWSGALQRRSQKSRMPWERIGPLVARWIPSAVNLHPRVKPGPAGALQKGCSTPEEGYTQGGLGLGYPGVEGFVGYSHDSTGVK
jgi:hypothetical protein